MKLLIEGDRGRAICDHCKEVVSTTYQRRDLPFSDGSGIAREILVAVCECCDAVVATPAQSTPAISAARRKADVPLEAVLPAIYLDALDLACYRISPVASGELRKPLFVYYLKKMENSSAKRSLHALRERSVKGTARKRLSMKVSADVAASIESLAAKRHLSKTDLIKDVVEMIHSDVNEVEVPKHARELKLIASVSNS